MLKKIVIFILGYSSVFAMHMTELNINKYDLEAGVKLDLGQFNQTVEPDTTFIGVSYLKAGNENASYSNNDIGGYFNINFMVKQDIKNTGFKVGLGVKSVYTSFKNVNFVAIPIGAEVSYKLPLNIVIPIGFNATAYYAPRSLSFSDADRYFEYRVEAYAQLMQKASLYTGYRNIDTKYGINNSLDYTYNESIYFGIKFSF